MKFIKKFVRDTKAATAIEYGLIAALIAALIAVAGITAMGAVGNSVSGTFNKVNTNLTTP